MTKKATKDTEIIHPIRQYLGLSYQRWTELNNIVKTTIKDCTSWSEVLVKLGENTTLSGIEYTISGGIFGELMLRKVRNIPQDAGLSSQDSEPLRLNHVADRTAEFPLYRTLDHVGLIGDEQPRIVYIARQQPRIGVHIAEMLSIVYPGIKHLRPVAQVSGGFFAVSQNLLEAMNGNRYSLFTGQDVEWHEQQGDEVGRVKVSLTTELKHTMVQGTLL